MKHTHKRNYTEDKLIAMIDAKRRRTLYELIAAEIRRQGRRWNRKAAA